ncbi:ABC transporter permease [Aquibacillus koreensis]|uniref:ABC transporter permease n=1 Tax=Aquibacillus koreensis TaxID=279446 RepID=A0A9X3WMM0_9BACI|nr:ABC transporter permease [Aquibacillus koreensis]MCT2535311.1 ABC transporter permease [Aquibacillus koreensis]MDC3422847.1 ABC transporter permease [Aquibacillus koreensis]
MFKQFYDHVEKSPKIYLTFAIFIILFYSGLSFTFVIPGLKGFDLFMTLLTVVMYFVAANIFVELYKNRIALVFIGTLLLSSLGMGWRLWLEWGEYSLVEHMNPVVLVGYPSISAFLITVMYSICNRYKK